jgi:hypothetical protein
MFATVGGGRPMRSIASASSSTHRFAWSSSAGALSSLRSSPMAISASSTYEGALVGGKRREESVRYPAAGLGAATEVSAPCTRRRRKETHRYTSGISRDQSEMPGFLGQRGRGKYCSDVLCAMLRIWMKSKKSARKVHSSSQSSTSKRLVVEA